MADALDIALNKIKDMGIAAAASSNEISEAIVALKKIEEGAVKGKGEFSELAKALSLLNQLENVRDKDIKKMLVSKNIEHTLIAKGANLDNMTRVQRNLALQAAEALLKKEGFVTEQRLKDAKAVKIYWENIAKSSKGVKSKEEEHNKARLLASKFAEEETALKKKSALEQGKVGSYAAMQWKEKFNQIGASTKAAADAMIPGMGGLIGKIAGAGPAIGIAIAAFKAIDSIFKGMSNTMEAMPILRFIGITGDPSAAISARQAFLRETASLWMSNKDTMELMEQTYQNYAFTSIPLTQRLTMSNTELDSALAAVNQTAAKNIVYLTNIGKAAGLNTAQSVNVAATIMNKMNVSSGNVANTFMALITRSKQLAMPVEELVDVYGKMNDKLRFANVGFVEMDPYIANLIDSFQSLASGQDKFWKSLGEKPEMAKTLIKDYFDLVQKVPAMTYMAFMPFQNRLAPGKMFLEALEASPFKKAMAVYGGFMDQQSKQGKDMDEAIGVTVASFQELQSLGPEAKRVMELIMTARKSFSSKDFEGKSEAEIISMVAQKTGRPQDFANLGATMRRMEEGPMAATNMILERILTGILSIATSVLMGGANRLQKMEMKQQLAGFGNQAAMPAMLRVK
jgi:hypothetical protein